MGKNKDNNDKGPSTRSKAATNSNKSRLASSAALGENVAPAKKQKRFTFDASFSFKLPYFKNQVKQLIASLENTTPSELEQLRKHVETVIAFLKAVKQEDRNSAANFLLEEYATALFHTSRAMYAAIFTEILQNLSQVTFEDLKRVYNKVYLTNQANAKNHESKAARVYFALCAIQSGRSTMEAAEFLLSQMNAIAKESKQFSNMAISAIATIAQRIAYDKNSKKLTQKYLNDLLPAEGIEAYTLQHFEAAHAAGLSGITSAADNITAATHEAYVMALTNALIEYETDHFISGVHPLWKQLLKCLAEPNQNAAIIAGSWTRVNEFFFASREIEHPFEINRISLGLTLVTMALNQIQAENLEHVITSEMLWHLSFCLTRDHKLQNPDLLKKPKAGSNMPYILKVPQEILAPVTFSAEAAEQLVETVTAKANADNKFATIVYTLLMNNGKDFAHIKKIATKVQQTAASSADTLKSLIEKMGPSRKPSDFINLVPSTFHTLKNINKEKLFEMLTLLFANAFFKPKQKGDRGKQDDVIIFDEMSLALRTQFAIKFFKILDTITRKEVEFYENSASIKNLMYPWSQRFAELYMSDFLNHPTLVPVNTLGAESIAVRTKLWALSDKISKLNKNSLDVVGMKILLYRMILFQLHDPSIVDESTAEDLETYLDAVYFNKKYDEGNPIETLTEILLYLFRESNLFIEISTFTLLYRKLELTPAALDSIFSVIKNCLKSAAPEEPVKKQPVTKKKSSKKDEDKMDKSDDEDDEDDSSSDEDDLNKQTSALVAKHIREVYNNQQAKTEAELDDDDMFELDEKIAQTVRASMKLTQVRHSSQTYAHAYRVIDLVQALYLLNPLKSASIVADKRYKLMIFCRIVDLLMVVDKQKGKLSQEQKTFVDRIASFAEGATQEKYCRFIAPQMANAVNKLSNPEYKHQELSQEESQVLTKDIVEDTKEKLDMLVDILSKKVSQRGQAVLTQNLFVRAFVFLVKFYYYLPGTNFAKQAVEAVKKIIFTYDFNSKLLSSIEFMIPDIMEFVMEKSLALTKKNTGAQKKESDARDYKFNIIRVFQVLLPVILKGPHLALIVKTKYLEALLTRSTEIIQDAVQLCYSQHMLKQKQGSTLNNLGDKGFYSILRAMEQFVGQLLHDLERHHVQTVKLDKQLMIKLVQEMNSCVNVMELLKGKNPEARKLIKYWNMRGIAAAKSMMRVQNAGDTDLFKSLAKSPPLPVVLSIAQMTAEDSEAVEADDDGANDEEAKADAGDDEKAADDSDEDEEEVKAPPKKQQKGNNSKAKAKLPPKAKSKPQVELKRKRVTADDDDDDSDDE